MTRKWERNDVNDTTFFTHFHGDNYTYGRDHGGDREGLLPRYTLLIIIIRCMQCIGVISFH